MPLPLRVDGPGPGANGFGGFVEVAAFDQGDRVQHPRWQMTGVFSGGDRRFAERRRIGGARGTGQQQPGDEKDQNAHNVGSTQILTPHDKN